MKKLNPAFRNLLVFIVVLFVFGAAYYFLTHRNAVRKKMSRGEMEPAQTRATEDYKKYFGKVPDVGMVRCEGLVVYYPAKDGGTFLPYPLFVTTPEKRDELLAKTMLSGLPMDAMGDYVDPIFPKGGGLERIIIEGDTLHLAIESPAKVAEKDLEVTAKAFLLTYWQFYGEIKNVAVNVGDRVRAEVSSPAIVKEPGPPVLLDAFLVKDEGEEEPHELRLIFDRPLVIEDLVIEDAAGKMLAGKVYIAEFSMAGIFTQAGPIELKEGVDFRVKYAVRDYLGREGQGDVAMTARVEVHSG